VFYSTTYAYPQSRAIEKNYDYIDLRVQKMYI